MRFFDTEGPVVAADHYRVPPLERVDLAEILEFIRQKKHFVLHAPRQTGKTSAPLALRGLLNGGGEGRFSTRGLHRNCPPAAIHRKRPNADVHHRSTSLT